MPVKVQCSNPECMASFSVAPGEEARFRRCPQCGEPLSGFGASEADGAPETSPEFTPPSWPSWLVPGATFAGRYEIIRVLGRGGMGVVYLARDAELDRDVALKVPLLDPDPDARRRFRREARSAAKLHHPNICPIHDVGEVGDQPYLTLAFIERTSLGDRLKARDGPMEPTEAAGLVRTLALAMQAAHEAGIVHRDLKPANVMMTPDGRPIIMDFGLARLEEPIGSLRTKTGQMMGTPAYMPLEQFQGDVRAIGPASDVYSLGVILFELLTGRRPFEGNAFLIIKELQAGGAPSASRFRPGLAPALEAACRRAMARDVGDRYGSMKEFARALDGATSREAGVAAMPAAGRVMPAESGDAGAVDPISKPAADPSPWLEAGHRATPSPVDGVDGRGARGDRPLRVVLLAWGWFAVAALTASVSFWLLTSIVVFCAFLTSTVVALALGVGLLRGRSWAWWITLLLHACLGGLAGLAALLLGVSMRSTPEYEESGLFAAVTGAILLLFVTAFVGLLVSGRTRRWFRSVSDVRDREPRRRG